MHLSIDVDDVFMRQLRDNLAINGKPSMSNVEIMSKSLGLYAWAVKESSGDRVIVSVTPTGADPRKLEQDGIKRVTTPPSDLDF
jgi:hypothetical protein